MAIYALKAPSENDFNSDELDKIKNLLIESTKNGVVKFGWSYIGSNDETSDLRRLDEKQWNEMTTDEINCYKKASFLLDVKKEDWIVQINLPEWGKCIAGKVIGEYQYGEPCENTGDFRHEILIDKNSLIVFDRNDDRVLPLISRRLKLQGAHWRIYYENEFFQSIENLKNDADIGIKEGETKELYYLRQDFSNLLDKITEKIHHNNPEKKLEHFFAKVFRKIPGVKKVDEYGQNKGFGTDYGADLIVEYCVGIPTLSVERIEKMVVQVKSYEGEHYDTESVNQIETAINKFNADYGLLITTGTETDTLRKALEDLSDKLSNNNDKPIPIELISGRDVARFVLKYAPDLLL